MIAKSNISINDKQKKGQTYNYVYILLCNNNSFYTGYTVNMKRRYQEHINGSIKCKFTRSFKPLEIAQCWKVYGDRKVAMKIEKYIKSLNRRKKEYLIEFPYILNKVFQNYYKF